MNNISKCKIERKQKWHYPSPITPRILHLHRRSRRKQPKFTPSTSLSSNSRRDSKGKLETLFDIEREFSKGDVDVIELEGFVDGGDRRRERVEDEESESQSESGGAGGGGSGGEVVVKDQESWRFQVEVLRAECSLMRMEKEIALKKLDRSHVKMEHVLRYVLETLLSAKRDCEENSTRMAVEKIDNLVKNLKGMMRGSMSSVLGSRNCGNFEKRRILLQRRLGKIGGISENAYAKEIRNIAEASLSMTSNSRLQNENLDLGDTPNVDILRRHQEGLSKEAMLERIEEYRSMLSAAKSSVLHPTFISKQTEHPGSSSSSFHDSCQNPLYHEGSGCTGYCKVVVKRLVEQVGSELEQWSHMQVMLGRVRDEMEQIQASKDFWEQQALDSNMQVRFLNQAVQEWRQKALSSESKINDLKKQVFELNKEIETLRKQNPDATKSRPKTLMELHREEKQAFMYGLKENLATDRREKVDAFFGNHAHSRRYIFKEIENSLQVPR